MVFKGGPMVFWEFIGGPMVLWSHGFLGPCFTLVSAHFEIQKIPAFGSSQMTRNKGGFLLEIPLIAFGCS